MQTKENVDLRSDLEKELSKSKVDGVLLVGYDYLEQYPNSPYDKAGLYAAWRLMQKVAKEQNKPVFAIGMTDTKTDGVLTDYFHFIPPGEPKERVMAIVNSLKNKDPEDISLLFGGLLSNGSVYKHLVGICREADTAEIEPADHEYALDFLSPKKIGYGKLIPELTEMPHLL